MTRYLCLNETASFIHKLDNTSILWNRYIHFMFQIQQRFNKFTPELPQPIAVV